MIPFYKQHKEIAAFIEAVDQVLNSNTVLIKQDFREQSDPVAYMTEVFASGAFCNWLWEAGEYERNGRGIQNVDIGLQALLPRPRLLPGISQRSAYLFSADQWRRLAAWTNSGDM